MHTFASVADFRFLNKVVLAEWHIYVVCFQTGIVQADLSGRPPESFQNFQ